MFFVHMPLDCIRFLLSFAFFLSPIYGVRVYKRGKKPSSLTRTLNYFLQFLPIHRIKMMMTMANFKEVEDDFASIHRIASIVF